MAIKQYDLVRVVRVRDGRFTDSPPAIQRHPVVGDVGTVVEVYRGDPPGFEVECCAEEGQVTVWLEVFRPDELERIS
jgi:Domain of unknown function (DUF4926)